jgi:hypothetical protein
MFGYYPRIKKMKTLKTKIYLVEETETETETEIDK